MRRDILMLRALGLGDFLTGVPAYRAVRRAFPDHQLVLAAPGVLTGLAALTGAVDEVLSTEGLQPLPRRTAPAVAVNLHGRGPQSHRLLDALAPARQIGFAAAGWDGPAWRDDEHEVDRWCRLLTHAGIDADPTDLRLATSPVVSPAPGAVVVHPGAAHGCRRWPTERFTTVAAALERDTGRVVVTGSAGERGLAQQVAAEAGLPADRVLAGRTDLVTLAAVVAGAALVVVGDTGLAHLATAYGTRSVVLFGPLSPALWGPRVAGPHRALWHGDAVRGDRWASDPDPALLAVSVDEVLGHCAALLDPARLPR